jgi:hypothetical protein
VLRGNGLNVGRRDGPRHRATARRTRLSTCW